MKWKKELIICYLPEVHGTRAEAVWDCFDYCVVRTAGSLMSDCKYVLDVKADVCSPQLKYH